MPHVKFENVNVIALKFPFGITFAWRQRKCAGKNPHEQTRIFTIVIYLPCWKTSNSRNIKGTRDVAQGQLFKLTPRHCMNRIESCESTFGVQVLVTIAYILP